MVSETLLFVGTERSLRDHHCIVPPSFVYQIRIKAGIFMNHDHNNICMKMSCESAVVRTNDINSSNHRVQKAPY